ncbi:MAG TPA: glyoxalase/bleomycin resistance/extradiol dioxygenase family protein [Kiloniellaceae bacterium]|nr:glyoxalase/bleomycin resistance/extradiol dioxygenase family protein [Kiloniellaceae bacterium]
MRLQLALNVRDIDAAVDYYSKLFGVKPHKHYDSYANFAIQEPPLKLVLFRNPEAKERLHHVGVEVMDDSSVRTTLRRLTEAGVVDEVQRDETCCHATQDKIWSREPDGLRWEWYRITDDAPVEGLESLGKTCCTGTSGEENIGCS